MISDQNRYPTYKDSGLPWLGAIPAHWQVLRNGRMFAQRVELGYPDLPILEVSLHTGVRVRTFGDAERKQVMSDREKYKRAAKGDIAYNMMRLWQGAVGAAPVDGLISPAYVVARPYPETDSRYFAYVFRTSAYMNEVNKYSRGIVKDRNRLYWDEFKQMPSPFPPTDEQTRIADVLDAHGRSVARYIRAKQRLIALLNEQQQAIIDRAVTRGVDAGARLAPSGVAWLGDVPAHWSVLRLKDVAAVVLGKMLKTTRSEGEALKPYLRAANVQWGRLWLDDVAEMWFSPQEMASLRLNAGDLLVSEGGEVGRSCLWQGELPECYIQNSVHKLTPGCSVRPLFLYYQFLTMGKRGYLESIVNRVSIGHLTREKLVNVRVVVPPLDEQDAVVEHIARATREPVLARQQAQSQIALVREYRTRLIADVVTGKLDVRQVAPEALAMVDGEAEPDEVEAALADEATEDGGELDGAEDAEEGEE